MADELHGNRSDFEKNKERNVFVIMRFGKHPMYKALERTIKDTVRLYGFKAILARDVSFHPDLWGNIKFCMACSRYAIVVFERMLQPDFNPNVSLELGYMLGLDKPCLLLKEATLPLLPTDIVGHLYREFDATRIKASVASAVIQWLEGLGQRRVKTVETIASENLTESKKRRTEAVVDALKNMKAATHACTLRQAGSMSSLAISENEPTIEAEDPELRNLLLQERNLIESLICADNVIRCLISPLGQLVSLQLNILTPDLIQSDVIPRFDQLSRTLKRYINAKQLQVAYTPRLPHDNVLIDEEGCRVFVGRRLLRQWGFPNTTIYYDPAMVMSEKDLFDSAFFDAAAVCLGKSSVVSDDCSSAELKLKVIEHLEWCKRQLVGMAAGKLPEPEPA